MINMDQMPGDDRTLIAFLAVDSAVHFFQFSEEDPSEPPRQIVANDVDGELPSSHSRRCVAVSLRN